MNKNNFSWKKYVVVGNSDKIKAFYTELFLLKTFQSKRKANLDFKEELGLSDLFKVCSRVTIGH